MKIVINRCFGGFGLSTEGETLYFQKTGKYFDFDMSRTDPALIEVIEELKEKANTCCSKLAVIEIPDDVDYYIHEYDGLETIHENHRSWS